MASQAARSLTAERTAQLKAVARELGFAELGVADLSPTPHPEALDQWLAGGLAGSMRYMHRQAAKRKRPETIVPGATRAVVVSYDYAQPTTAGRPGSGQVAAYARGTDYHAGLAPALRRLGHVLREMGGPDTIVRPFIDAGPVPERELAQRAGLGWIGKNTMLISPGRGSYTLLASILTNVALATDVPFTADRCGSCRRCLEACPTGAFPAPRQLDANRCISYLTIEHRGPIPPELTSAMGPWIFGCDVCQDVCPWNRKFARSGGDTLLGLDPGLAWIPLEEFTALDEPGFAERYGWTPLERAGLGGMRRNAAVAALNASRMEAP